MALNYVPKDNPLYRIDPTLLRSLELAQEGLLERTFPAASDLAQRALTDVRVAHSASRALCDEPVSRLAALSFRQLFGFWDEELRSAGVPPHARQTQAFTLAQQTQLLIAFPDPTQAVGRVLAKVRQVVEGFPHEAVDLERGRNPGDVLDPYILAATQYLMCAGSADKAIEHAVAHKALMMIEGLLGHLHEDVIGMMRGNVRVPEPRGADQENLDPALNPFPGADVLQPPWSDTRGLRFHQIKSKTGSAKGGDGRRLGEQLQRLKDLYGGEVYYHALIGNTLLGHRSMAGVLRAAPSAVVLVGESSFEELTGRAHGPELLLRVYQAAFQQVANSTGYSVEDVAASIVATFQERAARLGEGYLESLLRDATAGPTSSQDSRRYRRKRGSA